MPTTRTVDGQELAQYFHLPEKSVAKHLGMCLTSLKKICRNNGIHRWPYRKVKSMDRKMRKLEASSGSTDSERSPSDDGTLDGLSDEILSALGSDVNSPLPDFDAVSEVGEATASSATTPRGTELCASAASSPRELDGFAPHSSAPHIVSLSPSARSAFEPVPVRLSKAKKGQPVKLELSIPPNVLEEMANGGQNFTFTIQGIDSSGSHLQLCSERIQEAPQQKAAVKEEVPETTAGMSDEDIIAMLAGCAAPCQPRAESFAEVVRDKSSCVAEPVQHVSEEAVDVSGLEPSDAELMAALASCCGGQHPFNVAEADERGGVELYHGDDDMTWHGGMDEFLSEHA